MLGLKGHHLALCLSVPYPGRIVTSHSLAVFSCRSPVKTVSVNKSGHAAPSQLARTCAYIVIASTSSHLARRGIKLNLVGPVCALSRWSPPNVGMHHHPTTVHCAPADSKMAMTNSHNACQTIHLHLPCLVCALYRSSP